MREEEMEGEGEKGIMARRSTEGKDIYELGRGSPCFINYTENQGPEEER